mgnify:CR=1 FL=1|jgi:hypothetical protein|tara:strand:+ start:161 stop:634 length:474 start_codon:yes stop_codon:yes gene_type:complete
MIQFIVPSSSGGSPLKSNSVYLNIYDEYDSTDTYRALWTIQSQFTKKSKTFLPTIDYANKDRFVKMTTVSTYDGGFENLETGVIQLATTNFPLGFYDVIIYENTSNSNLDTSGLKVVFKGLMNLISQNVSTNTNTPPVDYTEYTTNDTDTESVYITF